MSNIGTGGAPRPDYRTPLKIARGLGSAKSGTGHWWAQRVTAVLLVLLVPWLTGVLVSLVGADLDAARHVIARPWNAIPLAAFVIAAFWHAKLGMQVVIEDYIHGEKLKLAAIMLNNFFSIAVALASIYAILKLSSGV